MMRWESIPWEVTSAYRREVLIMLYESMRQADCTKGGVSRQVSHPRHHHRSTKHEQISARGRINHGREHGISRAGTTSGT
jgi:hypothetical protein